MGATTTISWCDSTFNPWRGCTKVADGCANCYAESLSKRNPSTLGIWGPNGTRVRASDSMWREPLKWNRVAAAAGERHRVFCALLADVFEDWRLPIVDHKERQLFVHANGTMSTEPHGRQATLDDLRRDLFALIDATPNLDWLLLTKRPENVLWMWPHNEPGRAADLWGKRSGVPGGLNAGFARTNVWLLTSIATQADADRNIPELLRRRSLAPVLGVSAEPLIEAVDLTRWIDRLDWVIVGCESGPKRRPMQLEWSADLIAQCRAAGVACFVKQLPINGRVSHDPAEWPADLRVREFPEPIAAK